MNKLLPSAAILALMAFGAAAQDTAQLDIAKKKMAEDHVLRMDLLGAVQVPPVKGAPYSADEITEITQVLADGTRIHRETKVTVYRDSEGRTRRESPDNVTITGLPTGSSWMVNPKTNTVRKLQNTMVYHSTGPAPAAMPGNFEGAPTTFSVRTDGGGQADIEINGQALDQKTVAELIAKAKAEGRAEVKGGQVTIVGPPGAMAMPALQLRKVATPGGPDESLGKKNIEGVIAEGMRNVETIDTGVIGNDRPIQIVNEHWFSEELGTMVYSKRSDPRTGEEIFRVINIRRGDPPAYLFQPPADPAAERKM